MKQQTITKYLPAQAGELRITSLIIAVSLMFMVACGGGGGNNSGNNNNDNVTFSIAQADQQITIPYKKQRTISVNAVNTGFDVSPVNGAGCSKNSAGNGIVCVPTAAGTFTVTATATANKNSINITVTVPELVIEGLTADSGGELELKLSADETQSDPITLYAAEEWTAEVGAGTGGSVPSWIKLRDASDDVKNSSIVTIQAAADGTGATKISGTAGIVAIAVTLEPNYSGQERQAKIMLTAGSNSKEITVIQSPTVKGGNTNLGDEVSINISPSTAPVMTGESKTFNVLAVKTDNFTMSVSPDSGHGCAQNGNNVVCVPTTVGTYTITVTATVNASKQATATLNVLGIVGGGEKSFYADTNDSGNIAFNTGGSDWTAAVSGGANAPTWITLKNTSGTAANSSIGVTLENNYSGQERSAVIVINVNGSEIELTVVQRPTTSDGTVLGQGVTINISPDTNILLGEKHTFIVNSLPNQTAFTWSAPPNAGCAISENVKIVCEPKAAGEYEIKVTATENPLKTATARLKVEEVKISVTPGNATNIGLFSPVAFKVDIMPTGNTGFTFSTSPATGAGCSQSGDTLTCTPTAAKTYTITVTADAGMKPTASASFTAVIPETLNIALNGTVGIDMVRVEAGTFEMGCNWVRRPGYVEGFDSIFNQSGYCPDTPVSSRPKHAVGLTKDFYIGKYEVTQAQWNAVKGIASENNPSTVRGDNLPQTNVSWLDVMDFITELNERDAGKGYEWRLPTEAEWEYAARGGHKPSNCDDGTSNATYTCMYNGSNDGQTVWFLYNLGFCTGTVMGSGCGGTFAPSLQPVGQLASNELGLHDMAGNVREWVKDFSGYYSYEYQDDPVGPSSEPYDRRIVRGGYYNSDGGSATVFARTQLAQTDGAATTGFRLVLVPVASDEQQTLSVKSTAAVKAAAPQSGNGSGNPANEAPAGFFDGIISGMKSLFGK